MVVTPDIIRPRLIELGYPEQFIWLKDMSYSIVEPAYARNLGNRLLDYLRDHDLFPRETAEEDDGLDCDDYVEIARHIARIDHVKYRRREHKRTAIGLGASSIYLGPSGHVAVVMLHWINGKLEDWHYEAVPQPLGQPAYWNPNQAVENLKICLRRIEPGDINGRLAIEL